MHREEVVSSVTEELILVDELDREIGCRPKSECHEGNGMLHRAFSIFIFNERHELLLQKRSAKKLLWPDYWSNACCSHPWVGESMEHAVLRRLKQELGFECPLTFLYKFKYHAQYGVVGAEHEYCWVYYGQYDGTVNPNMDEMADWRFVDIAALEIDLKSSPENYTPWLKMEWSEISNHYLEELLAPKK